MRADRPQRLHEVRPAVEPEPVAGDLAHGQPARRRRRDGDREIRLALGQREHPRQRHHLHLQVGVVAAERVAGVGQEVVRHPVRRADPHRPRQPVGLPAHLLGRGARLASPSPGHAPAARARPRSARSPRASGRRAGSPAPPPARRSAARPWSGRARASAPPPAACPAAPPRGTRAGRPTASCLFAFLPCSTPRHAKRGCRSLRRSADNCGTICTTVARERRRCGYVSGQETRRLGESMQDLSHFIGGKRVPGAPAASPTSSTRRPARCRRACRWPPPPSSPTPWPAPRRPSRNGPPPTRSAARG